MSVGHQQEPGMTGPVCKKIGTDWLLIKGQSYVSTRLHGRHDNSNCYGSDASLSFSHRKQLCVFQTPLFILLTSKSFPINMKIAAITWCHSPRSLCLSLALALTLAHSLSWMDFVLYVICICLYRSREARVFYFKNSVCYLRINLVIMSWYARTGPVSSRYYSQQLAHYEMFTWKGSETSPYDNNTNPGPLFTKR